MKSEDQIRKQLNKIIEKQAIWKKEERKEKRLDYYHWFELEGAKQALEFILKEEDYELYAKRS